MGVGEVAVKRSYCLSSPRPGFNSQSWRSISRYVSLADHTPPTRPEPAWQKMAESPLNGDTRPVDIEEEALSPTMDRQWLKEIHNKGVITLVL